MERKWVVRTTKGKQTAQIMGTTETLELVAPAPNTAQWLVAESSRGAMPICVWPGYTTEADPAFPSVMGVEYWRHTVKCGAVDAQLIENYEALLAAAPAVDNTYYAHAVLLQKRYDSMSWQELLAEDDAELVVKPDGLWVSPSAIYNYRREITESDCGECAFTDTYECVLIREGHQHYIYDKLIPDMPGWLRKRFWPGAAENEDEATTRAYWELWIGVKYNTQAWWVVKHDNTVTLILYDGLAFTLPPATQWPEDWAAQKLLLINAIRQRTLLVTHRSTQ